MIKALIFKEWLKTRWILLAVFMLFMLVVAKIFLTVAYEIRYYEAHNYLYNVVFRNYIYFTWLLYLPALSGIILAIAQYYPEINEKRLKLTLHLPEKEEAILMSMLGYGILTLVIMFSVTIISVLALSSRFFPSDVGSATFITIYPWFLAGFVTYMSAAAIFIEPRWIQRIMMIIISTGFISCLLYLRTFNMFEKTLLPFTILSLFFLVLSLYSTNRFRRGVM